VPRVKPEGAGISVDCYVTVAPKKVGKGGDWGFAARVGKGSNRLFLNVYLPYEPAPLSKGDKVQVFGVAWGTEFCVIKGDILPRLTVVAEDFRVYPRDAG